MRAMAKLQELSWSDKLRAAEAFVCLGLARLAVLTVPLRLLARVLGQTPTPSDEPTAGEAPAASTLSLAAIVERVANHTPWSSNCLARAVAATLMLRRRGVRTRIYFGVARDDAGEIEAHAWTRSGHAILTGRNRIGRYTVVGILSNDLRSLRR